MMDDKENTLEGVEGAEEQGQPLEIGIQTDPVPFVICPGCSVEIDTEGIPSFTEIACPSCATRLTVPAQLDNFRLLSVLGAGGMGAVFLAQDDTLNRRVAIKVMLGSLGTDPAVLDTFRREAQSAARLNNPHIVQIYSFGEAKGQPYLVMELVSGDKLDDMIESGEPLDPAFVMRVGLEIVEGLATAQLANLVHGDIKPENILFDEKMQAKLVDFGIAQILSSKDSGNEIWGTPYYIAPEKAQHKKTDVRSDIYSLGATLYHAIAGRPPFDGEDAVAVIRARFQGPPTPLTEIRPGIEPAVVAIIERMMQNDLFLRYPNCNSLIKDMRKYLAKVPESRKIGIQSRKFRMRKSAGRQGGGLSSGALATASGGMRTTGGVTAGEGAQGASGGRKLVIQKGTLSSANASLSTSVDLSSEGGAGGGEGDAGGAAAPRGPSAKAVAILVVSLFGAGILIAIAVVAALLVGGHRREKAMQQKFVQAQAFEAEWDSLMPQLTEATAALAERDAEAGKILAAVGESVGKALSMPFEVPPLDPPVEEPPAPPAEAEGGDGEQTLEDVPAGSVTDAATATNVPPEAAAESVTNAPADAALASDAAGTNAPQEAVEGEVAATGAGEPAAGEAAAAVEIPLEAGVASQEAVVETPVLDGALPEESAPPKPAALLKAEALFEPARQIRARLREAERLRDREEPPLSVLKRETMSERIWRERQVRVERRRQDLERVRVMIREADSLLVAMRRMVVQFEKEAATFFAALRRQQEEEHQARVAAAAEEARRIEEARRQAKIQEEVDYVHGLVMKRRDLIDKYEYTKMARELERVRPDVVTEGGVAALETAIQRFDRLESLKTFLLEDLHENKGLRWGLGQVDIVDADAEGIVAMGGRRIPVDAISIPQWIHLIVQLLEVRPPERHIRVIEHGEQLFNAALFCVVHGAGTESSLTKAAALLRQALQRRTALRPDVPRLLPELADRPLEEE